HFGKRALPQPQQRKREAIDSHVVVFVKRARIFQLSRLAGTRAKLLDSDEVVRLAPHRAFPFAGLIRVMPPRDRSIVRRIVAAVVDVFSYRIINALDHSAIDGEPEHGRKKTLRYAVGRIDVISVAPLSDDVAVSKDDSVSLGAIFGNGSEQRAEGLNLGREVARHFALLSLRET